MSSGIPIFIGGGGGGGLKKRGSPDSSSLEVGISAYVRRVLRYLDQPTGGFVIFEFANGFQSTLR